MVCPSCSPSHLLGAFWSTSQLASPGCGSSVSSIKNIVQERSVRPLSQRKNLLTSTGREHGWERTSGTETPGKPHLPLIFFTPGFPKRFFFLEVTGPKLCHDGGDWDCLLTSLAKRAAMNSQQTYRSAFRFGSNFSDFLFDVVNPGFRKALGGRNELAVS